MEIVTKMPGMIRGNLIGYGQMIRIAICDDNREELDNVSGLVKDILSEQKINCTVELFTSADELLADTERIDIGILDIVIGEGMQNGIDLGCKLKEKYPDISLIYTTSYEKYVMQAINDVHAYSYLCKPIDREKMRRQILELIGRSQDRMLEKEFYHVIDSKNREHALVTLNLNDILYFEYLKRQKKVAIVLQNETYEYDCTFGSVVEEFLKYDFAVNCRGMMVNLRHILKMKGYTAFLDNGMELPIAQKRMEDFRKTLNEFLQKNS